MCNSLTYVYFVSFITLLACLIIIFTSWRQQSCSNNPALGSYEVWKCTPNISCAFASTLSPEQTVLCGDSEICCPEHLPSSTEVTTAASTPISPTEEDFAEANRIASEKCDEYAAYRYHNYTIPGKLIGDPPINRHTLDCPMMMNYWEVVSKEFPHMALLGYDQDVINDDGWHCSGSLISEQFILSAAHCTTSVLKEPVLWASLGRLSRKNFTTDMIGKKLFRIIQRFNHPQYYGAGYGAGNEKYYNNDIALYKLETPIKLNSLIRPICLTQDGGLPLDMENIGVIVTGWEIVHPGNRASDLMRKASIRTLNVSQCVTPYKDDPSLQKGFDVDRMICGGHTTDGDPNLCDYGEPMQRRKANTRCMWILVGISSIGTCAGNIPVIYTRISAYLPWIQKIVWPTNL